MPTRTMIIEVGGRACEVVVDQPDPNTPRFRVSWEEHTRVVDVRDVGPDVVSLVEVEGGERSFGAHYIETGQQGELVVQVAGHLVQVIIDRGAGLGGDAEAGHDGAEVIKAPMPGKVVKVLVTPGEEVEAKQGVVVVEAMKMENEFRTALAGTVEQVVVQEGQSVDAGSVLVVVQPRTPR